MSLESFVQAMPKVELHVHLEGAMQKERLLIIAEQNEIADGLKHFDQWVALLDDPDYARLYEIVATTIQWLQHPDDLTHVTYELGVWLARQNVRYAEIHVNPIHFTERGWSFEQYLAALNDGRSRAERGWGIQMRWVMTIARDQPRHADEIVRWASGQNNGIVGIDLGGPESAQPIGQFERAIKTAVKKQIPYSIHAGEAGGAESVLEALQQMEPTLLIDGWGVAESPEAQNILIEKSIPLNICLKRAVCHGWIEAYADYPLRVLLDRGISVLLSSDMPWYYQTTLTDEYLAAVQHAGLQVEELEQVALNAVQSSRMPEEDKAAMIEAFKDEYAQLRADHLENEAETEE